MHKVFAGPKSLFISAKVYVKMKEAKIREVIHSQENSSYCKLL